MRGLMVALVLGVAARAAAQQPAVDMDAAKARYAAGTQYFQADRFAEALHEFEQAFALSRRPALLYNIGLCHEGLGHADEALSSYRAYLDSGPTGEDRIDAEYRIARLNARRSAGTDTVVARAPAPPKPVARRRRWVWGVVGATAALVVGAVVVGVVLGTRDDALVLPDVTPR